MNQLFLYWIGKTYTTLKSYYILDMNLLESIRWDCIEWNDRRSLTVTNKIFDSEIGQQIILNGKKGIYVASSGLGITIFDLFSEILQESDMKRFLRDHG